MYVLQSGLLVNALGNGAASPFLVIYLHDVRGLPLAICGLAASVSAASGLLAALGAGTAGDRLGARGTMIGGLLLSTCAYVLYPLVREPWHALALAALAGTGIGTWLTMQSTLLAAVTPPEARPAAFAQQRVAANLGLGAGGFTAGLLVSVGSAHTFDRLFLLNALTFVVYAAFLSRLPGAQVAARRRGGSYRRVLRDPPFVGLVLVNVLIVAAGIALLASLFPVFAKNEVGVSEHTIGVLFLLNSLLIVVAQLPIANAHRGRRRMNGLALTATLFAAAWLLVQAAVATGASTAVMLLVLAVLVFAIGECLYDTVQGPLVSDLAREESRGRYMAVNGFSWQLGFIAGPSLGALLLTADSRALWPVAAGVCLVAAAGALAVEHLIPAHLRTTPQRKEQPDALGDARTAEDGSDRLPVADPQLHRRPARVSLRAGRGGARGRRA